MAEQVQPRPQVLLADDQMTIRAVVQEALEEAGYAVVAVASGSEAIVALEAENEFVGLVTDIISVADQPDGAWLPGHASFDRASRSSICRATAAMSGALTVCR